MVARTGRVWAAHDGHGEAADIAEGRDGTLGLVEVPQATTTGRTLPALGEQAQHARDRRAFGAAGYDDPPQLKHLLSCTLS